jgi:hypothetical protein
MRLPFHMSAKPLILNVMLSSSYMCLIHLKNRIYTRIRVASWSALFAGSVDQLSSQQTGDFLILLLYQVELWIMKPWWIGGHKWSFYAREEEIGCGL